MRYKNSISLWLVALALLLASCTKEPFTERQTGEKVTVQIHTKTFKGSVSEGVTIEKIRLMLFDKGGNLVLNSTTSNGTLIELADEKFSIDIETGSYRFVSMINETPELTAKLNALNTYAEVEDAKVTWNYNELTDENVTLANYGTMEITKGAIQGQGVGRVTEFDATGPSTAIPSNPIAVTMPRALAKLSLFMRTGDAVTEEVRIDRVDIINIPQQWSVVQQEITQMGQAPVFIGSKTIDATLGEIQNTNNKLQYHNFLPTGYIFPEKYFKPYSGTGENSSTNQANAAYLFITATYGGVPTTYKILIGEGDANFRLLRNTHYKVYATITGLGAIGIYAVIEPVRMQNITVNWKPVEGLVVVSDREADFDKNVNVWSDYSVYSGVLKVYEGSAFHDVLFKYGSLMAIKNDRTATTPQTFVPPTNAETKNDLIWAPGSYEVLNITDWNSIPYIKDGSDFTTGNTPEEVIAGKGDPCRLAALSPHQIGLEHIIDNEQWHMATPAEYALLMKAANGAGSENNDGYRSFHELLLPNVKYRDANGELTATHNNEGRYWSTSANQALAFNSTNLNLTLFQAAQPEQAYTVRCVRNKISPADVLLGPLSTLYYQGTEINGVAYSVNSNVPYWKMELITSGTGKGSSDDLNDFSFTPFASGVKHTTEGSYSAVPRIYIKRWEVREKTRSFGIRFSSIHFTGEEFISDVILQQNGYSITGVATPNGLDANNRFAANEGQYTLQINMNPTDVPMPLGAKLRIEYYYHGTLRGTSTEVEISEANKYLYEVEMKIIKNGTPDIIGLDFLVKIDEGRGYQSIGRNYFFQNN